MIELLKDLPFDDCEECECFEPTFHTSKMFADFKCVVKNIAVGCENTKLCKELRRLKEINADETDQ